MLAGAQAALSSQKLKCRTDAKERSDMLFI